MTISIEEVREQSSKKKLKPILVLFNCHTLVRKEDSNLCKVVKRVGISNPDQTANTAGIELISSIKSIFIDNIKEQTTSLKSNLINSFELDGFSPISH